MNILDFTGTKYIERSTSLPTIIGDSGEKGKTGIIALVSIGGQFFELPVDPLTGKFTWTAAEAMPDGDYSVSISIQDRAGNVGLPTLRTLRVDTTPPEAPLLIKLYDDYGPEERGFEPGDKTDDKRPTLTGIAQKGTTVYLLNEQGEKIGSAVADKDTGVWMMEPAQDLEDGSNALRLVAEEKFEGVTRAGIPSEPFNIVIEDSGTVPQPGDITITHAIDDVGSAKGELGNGALTDDAIPELRGTAPADSTVIVYYRRVGSESWFGSATATLNGESWSWLPGNALPTGRFEFQASMGDVSSALFTLDIASEADIIARTVIESASDDFGSDKGPLSNGAITDDATPTFRGRAEANAQVVVRYVLDGGTAASVVVNADSTGNWIWTPSVELTNGVWSFDVQPQGASGWSSVFKLEIAGSGENGYTPTISYAVDDFGGSTGERTNGSITDDTTPTLHGKAAANSVVYLQAINGAEVQTFSVQTDSSSNWTWTPPAALSLGEWQFQVSEGADEGWGKKFHLTVSDQIYTNQLNFEGALLGKLEDKEVQASLPSFNGILTWGSLGTKIAPPLGAHIVKTPDINVAKGIFGEQSLYLDGRTALFLRPENGNNNWHKIDKFSFQVLNASNLLGTLTVEFWDGYMARSKKYSFPANSVTTISREDFNINDDLVLSSFRIAMPETGGIPLYLDNFTWNTLYDRYNPVAETDDATAIQHLDSVDSLAAENIIGDENEIDTMQLTTKETLLDLTDATNKIESIEIFDITGTGDNTLKLDLNALLQHGEKDLFIEDGKTQLIVKGDKGDVVQLVDILPEGSDISEWQHQEGTITVAGVEYNVYSHGDDAELLVQQGVKTELV